jgi:hypothetical protein
MSWEEGLAISDIGLVSISSSREALSIFSVKSLKGDVKKAFVSGA